MQRGSVGVLAVLAVSVGVLAGWAERAHSGSAAGRGDPTRCRQVTIQGATPGTPYDEMALALRDRINAAGEGWTATATTSLGSAANLSTLRSPSATCTIAVAQLNVTSDAVWGAGRYSAKASYLRHPDAPIPDLRVLAPLYDDAIHLITTASGIRSVDDLCGKTVEIGTPDSGTEEVWHLLADATAIGPRCAAHPVISWQHTPEVALDNVETHQADAMIWSAAAPTEQVENAIRTDPSLRFLPLDSSFRVNLQTNFNSVFARLSAHIPRTRSFFGTTTLSYPLEPPVQTVGIPNGLVSRVDADPALVRFVTALVTDPAEHFERSLAAESFPVATTRMSGTSALATDSAFCLITLQPTARAYYTQHKINLGSCD